MTWLRDHLTRHRIVAILRAPSIADIEALTSELVDAGLPTIELTLTTGDALHLIERATAVEGATIAAGSVTTPAQVRSVCDAGARIVVGPIRDLAVEEACRNLGVPYVPGAMTPTEIHLAATAGAEVVKVFPVRSLGPRFIGDVLAPLPDLALLPTGGIGLDEVGDYLRAGAIAVGVGAVATADMLIGGEVAAIRARAERLVAAAVAAVAGPDDAADMEAIDDDADTDAGDRTGRQP